MPGLALLVIDMQNDFFWRHAQLAARRGELATSINALARGFRQQGQPVIWVRQELAADLSDAPLLMRKRGLHVTVAGTEGCEILPELERDPADRIIVKKRYSAFFGTGLDDTLADLRPEILVIAGINTHACVRTTVMDAYQRDYEVVVAEDCIASYDTAHHEITRRYLGDGIARFLSNAEILATLET